MTKRLKTTLLIFFTAVLLIATCLFAFPQFSVFADQPVDRPKLNLTDDNAEGTGNRAFFFEQGASIDVASEVCQDGTCVGFPYGDYSLKFKLNVNSLAHQDLLKYSDYVDNRLFKANNTLAKTYYEYKFTVHRTNDDYTSYPLEEITVRIDYAGTVSNPRLRKVILRKPLAIKTEGLDLYNNFTPNEERYTVQYANGIVAYPYYSPETSSWYNTYVTAKWKDYVDKGYEVLYWGEMPDGGLIENDDKAQLVLNVDSPYNKYFIEFEYKYYVMKKDRLSANDDYHTPNTAKGGCVSNERSIYEILKNADELEELEDLMEYFGDEMSDEGSRARQIADNILNKTVERVVTLEYLKQIAGTPFAEKVQTNVKLNVIDGETIHQDDIASSILGADVLECLNSYSKEPKYDKERNVFYLEYLDSVWLRCLTEDGNFKDFWFDINLSYEDTYKKFVADGVLPAGLYEYLFNQMKLAYKDENGVSLLANYDYDEVYGYFGFVAIPATSTLDSAFHKMFGDGTKTSGLLGYFESETSSLSVRQYNTLLNDYGYSWIEKIWNTSFASNITNLDFQKEATYHLFYADAYDRTDAVLGKGGQDKPTDGGAIDNAVGDVLKDAGDFIGGAWDDIVNGANTLWDTLTLPFKSSINIVVFALIGVGVVVLGKKLGIKLPKRSSGKKKKK